MIRTSRRGSQIIEFAILLPVLLGLVGIGLDVGWYMRLASRTTEAVFTGSRSAMFEEGVALEVAAANATRTQLELAGVKNAEVTAARSSGDYDVVTVTAVAPFVPLFGLGPAPAEIRYSLSMRAP